MNNPQTTIREKFNSHFEGKEFSMHMTADWFMKEIPEQMMESVDEYLKTPRINEWVERKIVTDFIQWYQKQLNIK